MQWRIIIAVFIGGAAGTYGRYLVSFMFPGQDLLTATLLVNVTGSFVLGFLTGWNLIRSGPKWLKLGLGTGLCGGYTTMSTFAAESVHLMEITSIGAFVYVVLSVLGGLLAAGLGLILSNILSERKVRT